jgi:hypothetical protein
VGTDPPQPSAPYTVSVTKPDGTKVPGLGGLDTSGKAMFGTPINQYGSYGEDVSVTVRGQTRSATTQVTVTAQQGTRCP